MKLKYEDTIMTNIEYHYNINYLKGEQETVEYLERYDFLNGWDTQEHKQFKLTKDYKQIKDKSDLYEIYTVFVQWLKPLYQKRVRNNKFSPEVIKVIDELIVQDHEYTSKRKRGGLTAFML